MKSPSLWEYKGGVPSSYFDVIAYPDCIKKNSLYYSCSQNAQRTSEANGGKGCKSVPVECKDGSWLDEPEHLILNDQILSDPQQVESEDQQLQTQPEDQAAQEYIKPLYDF